MPLLRRIAGPLAAVCLVLVGTWAAAGESYRFCEACYEKGELKYIAGLPVLCLAGTPTEIGIQEAHLSTDALHELMDYPRELLKMVGRENVWPKFLARAEKMAAHFPKDHLAELEAFARAAGVDRNVAIAANTMADMYRGGFGCSSLVVEASRSATHGPLFGHNLDFYGRGILHKYNLVLVYHPEGKHAFAAVGFPGLMGCLSGMNDAGLTVAVHEVFAAADCSTMFNPEGMPYSLCVRRMLEECTTVEEAEKLVRGTQRTTQLNVAVCDRRRAAVLEITPKSVALRAAVDGLCICTNHFRTPGLATLTLCRRYSVLAKAAELPLLDVADVDRKLDEANAGRLTLQTMVFEPLPLVLNLAVGPPPSSTEPLKRLPLAPLFATSAAKDVASGRAATQVK